MQMMYKYLNVFLQELIFMDTSQIQTLVSMLLYIGVVIGIGVYFARRANENSENYYLGGRSLGPWVAAFSAEASDMSGWLLMGLPGLAYWSGLADAFWTAAGLAERTCGCILDCCRSCSRYIYKLAYCGKETEKLFGNCGKRHNASGFLQQPFP